MEENMFLHTIHTSLGTHRFTDYLWAKEWVEKNLRYIPVNDNERKDHA